MPTKKGAGGRPQNYDARGRYAKTNYLLFEPVKPTKKEKARLREERRRTELYNRAEKSKDPYLFEVFLAIEKEFPGEVTAVNAEKYDSNIGSNREFDIITKKCIIEVKGKARRALAQLKAQRKFAEEHKKTHIVYSPDIPRGREKEYIKNGILITKNIQNLLQVLKEK